MVDSGRVVVLSNVTQYAGPPVAAALAADGFTVLCHDGSFDGAAAREAFEGAHPGCKAAMARQTDEVVAEALSRFGRLDIVVSNDAYAPKQVPIDLASAELFRETIEELLVAPFRLARAAASVMMSKRHGKIVLVTSAAPLRPYPGFSMYNSARSGASALAEALAKELGPFGIQVNAVAPNFLDSEVYFPAAQWKDNAKYAQRLKDLVPMQRFGRPEEIGALVAFLVSGKSDFLTGQVIAFTGGWP